jgi:hypothetical protein
VVVVEALVLDRHRGGLHGRRDLPGGDDEAVGRAVHLCDEVALVVVHEGRLRQAARLQGRERRHASSGPDHDPGDAGHCDDGEQTHEEHHGDHEAPQAPPPPDVLAARDLPLM